MTKRDKGRIDRRSFLKYSGLAGTDITVAECIGNQLEEIMSVNSGGSTSSDDNQATSVNKSSTDFEYAAIITPTSFNPMKGSDNTEAILLHNLYDPLFYYTDETPPTLQNQLATDYIISEDRKIYTSSLREDAAFRNGDSATASDVKYSFQRIMDVQQGFFWIWSGLLDPENVETTNKYVMKMTTNEVFAPFPYTLLFFFIVNKDKVSGNVRNDGQFDEHGGYGTEWPENNDAGSGSYTLAKCDRKQQIVTNRNTDWWGFFPDGNVCESVTTETAQEFVTIARMMKEGAGISDQWPPLKTYEELDGVDGILASARATFNPFYIYMHIQRRPLDDVHVREAISFAFDSGTALNDMVSGDSSHLNGLPSSAMWSRTSDLPTYERDLERAKAEFRKSDYSASSTDLTRAYVSGLFTEQNMGLFLQSNLQELGAAASVEEALWVRITQVRMSKDTAPDMITVYLSFSCADPDTFLYPARHSPPHGSWTSMAWYKNDEIDSLLTEGYQTIGKKNRIPIYQQAQKRIAEDAPVFFVMNRATRSATADSTKGFQDNGIIGYRQSFQRLYQG